MTDIETAIGKLSVNAQHQPLRGSNRSLGRRLRLLFQFECKLNLEINNTHLRVVRLPSKTVLQPQMDTVRLSHTGVFVVINGLEKELFF
jgi:hypothetical protein